MAAPHVLEGIHSCFDDGVDIGDTSTTAADGNAIALLDASGDFGVEPLPANFAGHIGYGGLLGNLTDESQGGKSHGHIP